MRAWLLDLMQDGMVMLAAVGFLVGSGSAVLGLLIAAVAWL